MALKRSAAAASLGSASDASDGEAGAARNSHRRRVSPSRSRSESHRPNLGPSAAASDTNRERSPRDHLDSDADSDADAGAGAGRGARSSRLLGERSPSFHSNSDADVAGRSPSPRRNRERTLHLHSDSDSDNSTTAAAAASDDAGDASPLAIAHRASHIGTSNVKPVSTRPMDVPSRAAAGSSQRRSKRRPSPHSPEHQKRPPRVWSPEDEVTILSALIEFRAKKGRLPASIQDTSKVHSQIIHQLTANASTAQLSDKVRRLKHKYKLLLTRSKNGRDPDLPTKHDRDVYQLSKKVWGLKSLLLVRGSRVSHEDTEDAEESNEEQEIEESDEDIENEWGLRDRTGKKPRALTFENGNGNAIVTAGRACHGDGSGRDDAEKGKQMYPYLWEAVEELSKEHPSGPIFRKAFGVLEKSKAGTVEEKLRKFRMLEIRQQLRRMDLMKETVGLVLDALEGAY
ncbi:STOREKEEPER protein [Zea mays]|uniref:STOREKEEPER protein n=1 Tax=Zea mays TaxID=4577 RepID=A0A3L6F8X9_MAIZE|nr:STOREKEEPER protein [Zea mays]